MTSAERKNERTPSTRWEWRLVKIGQPPQANEHSAAQPHLLPSLLPWPRRKPLTLRWSYRGGPEAWIEVRARGRVFRFTGDTAMYDAMRTVHQWWSH